MIDRDKSREKKIEIEIEREGRKEKETGKVLLREKDGRVFYESILHICRSAKKRVILKSFFAPRG